MLKMNLQRYPESHLGSSAQKRPIAFPRLLFTIKKEEVSILLLDWGPFGPDPGRARKGPPDGPRAVSALPSATAGCINSGPCNRRPQSISGVSGEPRNADRLDPRSCHGHFLTSGTGPAAQNPPKRSKNGLFGVSRWGHLNVLPSCLPTDAFLGKHGP